jgi:hypothetical protein
MASRDPEGTQRMARAGLLALALHGAVLWLASTVAADRAAAPAAAPARTSEISVEIMEPIRPAPAVVPVAGPRAPAAPAAAGARAAGRRTPEGGGRSRTRAPATGDPWAELQIRYDAPTEAAPDDPAGDRGNGLGAAHAGTGLGAAQAGTGLGAGGDALRAGGLPPPPPPPSHAAPPRPRYDYSQAWFQGARGLWGMTARAELSIDTHGQVNDVRITEHINQWIDYQATAMARSFVFYPALNDAGEPVAGTYVWTFVITH